MRVILGDPLPLQIKAVDGNTALFPRARVYDAGGTPLATRDLVHLAQGVYRDAGFTPVAIGALSISYQVFADAGHTILSDDYEHPGDQALVEVAGDEEPMLSASYVPAPTDTLKLAVWVLRAGLQAQDLATLSVQINSADNTPAYASVDVAPDTQGVFRVSFVAPGLIAGAVYTAALTVTMSSGRVIRGMKSFKAIV